MSFVVLIAEEPMIARCSAPLSKLSWHAAGRHWSVYPVVTVVHHHEHVQRYTHTVPQAARRKISESGAEHRAYASVLRDQHDEAHGYERPRFGTTTTIIRGASTLFTGVLTLARRPDSRRPAAPRAPFITRCSAFGKGTSIMRSKNSIGTLAILQLFS